MWRNYYFRNVVAMVGISVLILSGSAVYDLRFPQNDKPYDWREIRESGVLRVAAMDSDSVFVGHVTRFAEEKKLEVRVRFYQSNDELLLCLDTFGADLVSLKRTDDRYSWRMRKSSTELRDTVDFWYDRNVRYVSKYDSLYKVYGDSIGWDWKLLAAVGYVESKFRNVHSRGGIGIMQLSRNTADAFGAKGSRAMNPHYNIKAAANYITYLERYFKDVTDFKERQKFVLAGYNSGGKAVKAAMQRARENKKNPYKWAQVEPYYKSQHSKRYLRLIFNRYDYYCEKE